MRFLFIFLAVFLLKPSFADSSSPRLVMFIGLDISGSFVNGKYYEDSMNFLAQYLHAHLEGLGGLEKPTALFVGSLGGVTQKEPKSFYPIQTFQGESVEGIAKKLSEYFPKTKLDPHTDYNAFFNQVATTVKNRKLILKPISVVLLSDGIPDIKGKSGNSLYRSIDMSPLESLSRSVTVRLLYTDARVGQSWQNLVPRTRVKMWTQDAVVMATWKDPKILKRGLAENQHEFFAWVKDNVDFNPRIQRVR